MLNFRTSRTVTVSGPAIPRSKLDDEPLLELRSLRGEERLGEIYEYVLELVTPSEPRISSRTTANLDLKAMIARALNITIQLEGISAYAQGTTIRMNIGAGTREISGLVMQARYLGHEDRRGRYEVILKPWLALAQQHTDYRIFQRQSVVEIIQAVLGNYPFSYELRLSETYEEMDLQTQYGESDFDFIQRLMQEHGIYWFFEHRDTFHTLILVDHICAHRKVQSEAYHTLEYHPPGSRIDKEHISEFTLSQSWQAGVFTTDDYDFKQPSAILTQQAELPQHTALNMIERYEWPGDYTDRERGHDFASVRMQEIRSRGLRAFGRGNLRDVECGTLFTLAKHPQDAANDNYVVIAARLEVTEKGDVSGNTEYSFQVFFEAQTDRRLFRPARTIPKPRTGGPQPAVVTGVEGSEIHTDQYARVKVKFHWDRLGSDDQNSSCWVRVMYPWAGSQFGSVSVPRVGTEVIVDFVNGDPDRPIVVGQMYRQFDMPAWELPGNQALSGYRSRELGGGRANSLILDDTNKKIQAHIGSEEGHSALSLGYITRIDGNAGRKEERGRGFELATQLWGVVRSAMGMLVTTESRGDASPVKGMEETVARLTNARDIQESLAGLARQHGAQQPSDQGEVASALKVQNDAIRGGKLTPAQPFPEFTRPDLVLASPEGMAATSGRSVHVAANEHIALTSVGHVALAAGRSVLASIQDMFSVFAKKSIRLISGSGRVEIQAQQDDIHLIAQKVLELISTTDSVRITAAKTIELTVNGTSVHLGPDGFVVKTLGVNHQYAASHAFPGPQGPSVKPVMTRIEDAKVAEHFVLTDKGLGLAHARQRYRITLQDGQIIEGVSNDLGETSLVMSENMQIATVELLRQNGSVRAIFNGTLVQDASAKYRRQGEQE